MGADGFVGVNVLGIGVEGTSTSKTELTLPGAELLALSTQTEGVFVSGVGEADWRGIRGVPGASVGARPLSASTLLMLLSPSVRAFLAATLLVLSSSVFACWAAALVDLSFSVFVCSAAAMSALGFSDMIAREWRRRAVRRGASSAQVRA